MTPWWLITLSGVLGSAHCVGMCGGFAVMLGVSRPTVVENLRTQLTYSCGRLASYASLGAVAGYGGRELMQRVPAFVNVPATLSLVSGLFLIWEGTKAAGWQRWAGSPSVARGGCLLSPLMSALLRYPALRHAFAAGVLTAFLPCGLVYAFVSLAASSSDLVQGAGVMLAFGLGTIPLMVLTGAGWSLLGASARRHVWTAAAWSVVLTGLLTCGRGVAFLRTADLPPAERCPFCASGTAKQSALASPLIAPVTAPQEAGHAPE